MASMQVLNLFPVLFQGLNMFPVLLQLLTLFLASKFVPESFSGLVAGPESLPNLAAELIQQ